MNQFLLFKIGQQKYSLEVELIQEIVEKPILYFIPCAPPFYCGAMNFHGEILPVLDVDLYLERDRIDPLARVLVLHSRIAKLALKVETARHIISINPLELQPPSASNNDDFPFQRSKFKLQEHDVSVLDLVRLLQQLKESTNSNCLQKIQ